MLVEVRKDSFDSVWHKETASIPDIVRGDSNSILRMLTGKVNCPLMWNLRQRTKSLLIIQYQHRLRATQLWTLYDKEIILQ